MILSIDKPSFFFNQSHFNLITMTGGEVRELQDSLNETEGRYSQVVRQWIANPPSPSSNLGAACLFNSGKKEIKKFLLKYRKYGTKKRFF